MISVKIFYKHKDNNETLYMGYEVSGHAEYAEIGEDILCASVSVLSINTANALEELTDIDLVIESDDDGYIKVIATNEPDSYSSLLINAFVLGILNIHDDYSNEDNVNEFIHIKFEEV